MYLIKYDVRMTDVWTRARCMYIGKLKNTI